MGYKKRANDWKIERSGPRGKSANAPMFTISSKQADVAAVLMLVETSSQAGAHAAEIKQAVQEYHRLSLIGIVARNLKPLKERFRPFCLEDLHLRNAELSGMSQINEPWLEYLLIPDYFRHFWPRTHHTWPGKMSYEGKIIVPELELMQRAG